MSRNPPPTTPPPPPALKFSRESPPFNSEISQPPLPFLKFWLESQAPPPLEKGGGYPLCFKSISGLEKFNFLTLESPYFTGQAQGNEFCVPCDLKGAAMQII